jgi:hypothetical protein
MVDLVETIKMCNAIKMNEITFYYHHEHISLKKKTICIYPFFKIISHSNDEEINKKQSNKQTDKQTSRKHVTLYIIYAFECEIILKKG